MRTRLAPDVYGAWSFLTTMAGDAVPSLQGYQSFVAAVDAWYDEVSMYDYNNPGPTAQQYSAGSTSTAELMPCGANAGLNSPNAP